MQDAVHKIIDAGDVLIVGAGLAGLFTALKLAPCPTTVLTPAPIGKGASSAWAQGGIAAAIDEGDTPDAHAADTIAAGAGIVDPEIAHILANEARQRIEDLLRIGVPFDRTLEGKLAVGLEAAHSHRRIVHVRGDQAGRAIMEALVHRVRATPSITVLENFAAFELARSGTRIAGVYVRDEAGRCILVRARAVVLATGGAGNLYEVTTNPAEAAGTGMAMAARAGALIADPEFVQFHPTAIACDQDPAPLVTEALRGEGAVLVGAGGKRIMPPVHPDGDLAPRDVVARAIARELHAGRRVFLDARDAIGARFAQAFPTVAAHCANLGIDPVRDPIPVAPAAHYHMGGVWTDAQGRSSLDGLWCVGETSSTGAHGANRLASNSLLEAVVFGARVAEDVAGALEGGLPADGPVDAPELDAGSVVPMLLVKRLRHLMSRYAGVARDAAGLRTLLCELRQMRRQAGARNLLANRLVACELIASAALAREESRGGHFRADFPETLSAWQHRTIGTLADLTARADAVCGPAPLHEAGGAE